MNEEFIHIQSSSVFFLYVFVSLLLNLLVACSFFVFFFFYVFCFCAHQQPFFVVVVVSLLRHLFFLFHCQHPFFSFFLLNCALCLKSSLPLTFMRVSLL